MIGWRRVLVAVIFAVLLPGCIGLGSERRSTESPSPREGSSATTDRWVVPTHPIVIEGDRFVDIRSGTEFPVRGVNYFQVMPVEDHYADRLLASDVFDADAIREDFTRLAEYGYTVVRTFIDGCRVGRGCISQVGVDGLNGDFLDRLAELMRIAKETGLFLVLTSGDLPGGGGYTAIADAANSSTFPGYRNTIFLTTAGADAAAAYWDDLLTGLVEREADFDAVLGWAILNEEWVRSDQPPLSLRSGVVTGADGRPYDMAMAADRRQLVLAGVTHYTEAVASVIRRHDPTSLVTMGFFAPNFPNPTSIDPILFVDTAPLLETTSLDFFDFHAYPGWGVGIESIAENFGLVGYSTKPVIMGEFGAWINRFDSADEAAVAMQNWVADSCSLGFDGWLYWGYFRADMRPDEVTWSFTDADARLLELLSPRHWPDPCVAQFPDANLAYERPVSVSAALGGQPGAAAVDGDRHTRWGSGEYAPQWISVQLDGPSTVAGVRLRVDQLPPGRTTHEVAVAAEDGVFATVHTFEGETQAGDVLEVTFDEPFANVVSVRVTTTASPSWVAWAEIEVLAVTD